MTDNFKHHWIIIQSSTYAMEVPGGVIVKCVDPDGDSMVFVPDVMLSVAADGSVQIVASGPTTKEGI